MTTDPPTSPDFDVIEEEAIAWFVVRQDAEGFTRQEEFERWRARSATHAASYARIERLYGDAAILQGSGRFGKGRNAPTVTAAVARHWRVPLVAALAALVVVGLGLLLHIWSGREAPALQSSPAQVLASDRGAIRSIRLADGSTITLDAASRVDVRLSESQRRFALVTGRARLDLVNDGRPFIVTAAQEEIAGQAALLDVETTGEAGQAVLWHGAAQARPLWHDATFRPDTAVLRPATARALGPTAGRQAAPRDAVGSRDWPSGWAEYRALPLSTLVEVVNSYGHMPLQIDDPAIASELVSGRFRLTDPDAVAQRLAEVFNLVVSRRADGIHLAARK
ncbi:MULTISPECIES: FecR domain-containing protein [unclassified Novosphingobium]|uniref:FecR family protein n=1 Tax=unclassified Novosphingobium TaxID=2644732 RepID=UPI00146A712E|nr:MULTISPECIES: FecR domain-containing protein [unclassified Novosphingobium]NMN04814.1 transmembrane sensor [Novosphingobium sp. SG919]NMN85192.1 transmembrane sensor [Novosphingobium sp. SG916]